MLPLKLILDNSRFFAAQIPPPSSPRPENSTNLFLSSPKNKNLCVGDTLWILLSYSFTFQWLSDYFFPNQHPVASEYTIHPVSFSYEHWPQFRIRNSLPCSTATSRISARNIFMVLTLKISTNRNAKLAAKLLRTETSAAFAISFIVIVIRSLKSYGPHLTNFTRFYKSLPTSHYCPSFRLRALSCSFLQSRLLFSWFLYGLLAKFLYMPVCCAQ